MHIANTTIFEVGTLSYTSFPYIQISFLIIK